MPPHAPHNGLFFRQLRPLLLRRAQRLCREAAAAEDLVQAVLLKLWESGQGQDPSSPKNFAQQRAWAMTVLYRDWVSTLRKRKVRHRYRHGAMQLRQDQSLSEHSHSLSQRQNESFTEAVQQRRRQKKLQRALFLLPRDQRRAIHLVHLQGLSTKESATQLRCPPGTLMSRLHRGRRRLAQVLQPEMGCPA